MTLVFSPRIVGRLFAVVVLALTLGHLGTQTLRYVFGHDSQMGVERLLNLNGENNLPSWYASSTLLLCALLLAVIGCGKRQEGDRHALRWMWLSAIFLYLSADEAASLHELANEPFRTAFHAGGYLYYAWVIPVTPLVAIIGASYFRFLRELPAATRRLFLLAGMVYLLGALGVETIGADYDYRFHTMNSLTYAVLVSLEEGCEMVGVLIFLYALCAYIAGHLGEVRLTIRDEHS